MARVEVVSLDVHLQEISSICLITTTEANVLLFVPAMRPGERVARFKAETGQDALAQVESGPTTTEQMGKNDGTGAGRSGEQQTAPAGVMTRLILTMVWRRLIRNPNTYASFIGITWSLVAFRYLARSIYLLLYIYKLHVPISNKAITSRHVPHADSTSQCRP